MLSHLKIPEDFFPRNKFVSLWLASSFSPFFPSDLEKKKERIVFKGLQLAFEVPENGDRSAFIAPRFVST